MKISVKPGQVSLGKACPTGKILRAGYVRKDGVRVKPACVPDKGAPGKTPAAKRWAKFPKGPYLQDWGKNVSVPKRHMALKALTRREGCLSVSRSLTQLANVTTDRPTETKARKDRKWLVKQDWCRLKTKK